MKYAICNLRFLSLVFLAISIPAWAWGPHTEVTQAGLDMLAPDDPIVVHLGPQFQRLAFYSWMGDYQGSLMEEPDGGMYYADDYLLFPKVPKHTGHLSPDVNRILEPYFKRAVQALRTETPLNAARWIGTLLHFTEDAGAPPHALGVLGDTHFGMENWIDKTKIKLDAYKPSLLGGNDDAALAGYLRRMDGLSAYAKAIGEKTKPLVEAGRRAEVEPLSLECAMENSRVVADLLHTLGAVALYDTPDSAILRGTINPFGDHHMAAKIVLDGTDYSTLTDSKGQYEFRNLPPGKCRGHALCPGFRTAAFDVVLAKRRTLNISHTPSGNLVRNPDLRLRWITPDYPDAWRKTGEGWESDPVPVKAGQRYQLTVEWKQTPAKVVLRWFSNKSPELGTMVQETVEPDKVYTAPEKSEVCVLLIQTNRPLADVCRVISLVPSQ